MVAKTGPSTWLLQLSLASILGGEQPAGTISDKRKSVCCAVPPAWNLGIKQEQRQLGQRRHHLMGRWSGHKLSRSMKPSGAIQSLPSFPGIPAVQLFTFLYPPRGSWIRTDFWTLCSADHAVADGKVARHKATLHLCVVGKPVPRQ